MDIVSTEYMKVLDGDVNINSDIFKKNYESMKQMNEDLEEKVKYALDGGRDAAIERHLSRGKFLGIIH